MIDFLSQYLDRSMLFFIILFATAALASMISVRLEEKRAMRPDDDYDDHDEGSRKR